jgi:hypothetical protein
MEYNLLKIIGDLKVCTDFRMLQVKVPIIFFGTPVFSARRDGRYRHEIKIGNESYFWINEVRESLGVGVTSFISYIT